MKETLLIFKTNIEGGNRQNHKEQYRERIRHHKLVRSTEWRKYHGIKEQTYS